MSDDLNCLSNFEMRETLLFVTASHGEKRGIEYFKFISPTHTRCTKLQVQYTHTQIISSLTPSKSWMKPVVDVFESVFMLSGRGKRQLTQIEYMT